MKAIALLALLATSPAVASITAQDSSGFTVEHLTHVTAAPTRAFTALRDIAHWWDGEHSFSKDARNLRMDLRPGGCLCEDMPGGGGVEHLRISALLPGQMVILHGGMGPLIFQGVTGTMTISFTPAKGGADITWRYATGGRFDGGAAKWAGPVDRVIGEQARRLASYINTGKPTP